MTLVSLLCDIPDTSGDFLKQKWLNYGKRPNLPKLWGGGRRIIYLLL